MPAVRSCDQSPTSTFTVTKQRSLWFICIMPLTHCWEISTPKPISYCSIFSPICMYTQKNKKANKSKCQIKQFLVSLSLASFLHMPYSRTINHLSYSFTWSHLMPQINDFTWEIVQDLVFLSFLELEPRALAPTQYSSPPLRTDINFSLRKPFSMVLITIASEGLANTNLLSWCTSKGEVPLTSFHRWRTRAQGDYHQRYVVI